MTTISRLRSVEHFLVAAQSADPTTGQLWALQELQRAIVEVEQLAEPARLLLDDVEKTAKNSFDPTFVDEGGIRKRIPWREGWQAEEPDLYDICQRMRTLLL